MNSNGNSAGLALASTAVQAVASLRMPSQNIQPPVSEDEPMDGTIDENIH